MHHPSVIPARVHDVKYCLREGRGLHANWPDGYDVFDNARQGGCMFRHCQQHNNAMPHLSVCIVVSFN